MTSKHIASVYKIFTKNYELVPLEIFGNNLYKTLISTILSARTRDEVTLEVCKKLFKVAPDLTSLNKLSQEQIAKLIKSVNYHQNKAKYLKGLSYIKTIPTTHQELVKLPGVGIKTANLVLNRALNIPAIAVDTHVHRIVNLLGWVKTKTPQETDKALHRLLPKKYWASTNRLFVSIGRQYRSERQLKEFLKNNKLI